MPTADELLGREQAAALHRGLAQASGTPLPTLARAFEQLEGQALAARAKELARAALADLPPGAPAIAAVRAAAADPDFAGWLIWPAGLVAAQAALAAGRGRNFDDAMDVLGLLTPRNTSEFSIRPLLAADHSRALAIMREWTTHENFHVRRLASEGARPYLPWGQRIPALVRDPLLTLPILDALRDDPEDFVRRSVANHLNDHSREHGAWVLQTAARWAGEGGAHHAWVVKHSLRTLVKRGDPGALALLGFERVPVQVTGPVLDAAVVPFGGAVTLGATVRNTGRASARLAIDFALLLPGSRGEQRRKVFKWATPTLEPGQSLELSKRYSFKPISTRRYYPGTHGFEVLVNGESFGPTGFEVLPPR